MSNYHLEQLNSKNPDCICGTNNWSHFQLCIECGENKERAIIYHISMARHKQENEPSKDIDAIKKLGEAIGYGHIMSLASALWAESLRKEGLPDGAFIPALLSDIVKPHRDLYEKERDSYLETVRNHPFASTLGDIQI